MNAENNGAYHTGGRVAELFDRMVPAYRKVVDQKTGVKSVERVPFRRQEDGLDRAVASVRMIVTGTKEGFVQFLDTARMGLSLQRSEGVFYVGPRAEETPVESFMDESVQGEDMQQQ